MLYFPSSHFRTNNATIITSILDTDTKTESKRLETTSKLMSFPNFGLSVILHHGNPLMGQRKIQEGFETFQGSQKSLAKTISSCKDFKQDKKWQTINHLNFT